jgi:serine/threonine protein kinase
VFDPQLKTMKGAQAFTPGYSPIEQYGKGMTDERSDIYALAATLYAALTGAIPAESVQRNLSSPLVPPRSLKPSITPATEGAILKAMEVVPADRYRTMSEFKKALRPSPLAPTVAVDQTAEMPISVMLPAISSSASFARAKSPPKNQDSNFWTCLFAIFLFAMLIMFVCICGVVFLLTAPSSFWRSLGF